jgi:hypothetical protein
MTETKGPPINPEFDKSVDRVALLRKSINDTEKGKLIFDAPGRMERPEVKNIYDQFNEVFNKDEVDDKNNDLAEIKDGEEKKKDVFVDMFLKVVLDEKLDKYIDVIIDGDTNKLEEMMTPKFALAAEAVMDRVVDNEGLKLIRKKMVSEGKDKVKGDFDLLIKNKGLENNPQAKLLKYALGQEGKSEAKQTEETGKKEEVEEGIFEKIKDKELKKELENYKENFDSLNEFVMDGAIEFVNYESSYNENVANILRLSQVASKDDKKIIKDFLGEMGKRFSFLKGIKQKMDESVDEKKSSKEKRDNFLTNIFKEVDVCFDSLEEVEKTWGNLGLSSVEERARIVRIASLRYGIAINKVEAYRYRDLPINDKAAKLKILKDEKTKIDKLFKELNLNYLQNNSKDWGKVSEAEKAERLESFEKNMEEAKNNERIYQEYLSQIREEEKELLSVEEQGEIDKQRKDADKVLHDLFETKRKNYEKYGSAGIEIGGIYLDSNGFEIDGRLGDDEEESKFKEWLLANGYSVYEKGQEEGNIIVEKATDENSHDVKVSVNELRRQFRLCNSLSEVVRTMDDSDWWHSMEFYARAMFDELAFSEGSLFTVFMTEFPKRKPPKEICDICDGYEKMSKEKWQSIATVMNDIHNCCKAWSSTGNLGNSEEFLKRIATSLFARDVVDMNDLPGWKLALESIIDYSFQESDDEPSVNSILDEVYVGPDAKDGVEIRAKSLTKEHKLKIKKLIKKKTGKEYEGGNSDKELLKAVSQSYGREDITKPFLAMFTEEGYLDFQQKDRGTLKKEAWERFQNKILENKDGRHGDLKGLLTHSARSRMLLHITFLSAWEYNVISANHALATPLRIEEGNGKIDPLLGIPTIKHLGAGAHKGTCQYCISQLRNFWRQKKKFFPFEFRTGVDENGFEQVNTYGGDQEMYADAFGKWIHTMFLSGNVRQKAAALEMMRDIYYFKSSFMPNRIGFGPMEFMMVMDETDDDPSNWRNISHLEAVKNKVDKIATPKKMDLLTKDDEKKYGEVVYRIPKEAKITKYEENKTYFIYNNAFYLEYKKDGVRKCFAIKGMDTNIYKRWSTAEINYCFKLLDLFLGKIKSSEIADVLGILNDAMEVKLPGLPDELKFLNTMKGKTDYFLFRHMSKDPRVIATIAAQMLGLANISNLTLNARGYHHFDGDTIGYTDALKTNHFSSISFLGKLMNMERGSAAFIPLRNKLIKIFGGGRNWLGQEKSRSVWVEEDRYRNKEEANDRFRGATVEDAIQHLDDLAAQGKRINYKGISEVIRS